MAISLQRLAGGTVTALLVAATACAAPGRQDAWNSTVTSGSTPHAVSIADVKAPKLTLKAQPTVSISPSRVLLTAELVGGPNDYQDYYCPSVEWDWGDGTISENYSDCDPYVAGKSTIQRRFTAEHIYRQGGAYRIIFRLKQKTKAVGNATTNVQVRSGVGEAFGR